MLKGCAKSADGADLPAMVSSIPVVYESLFSSKNCPCHGYDLTERNQPRPSCFSDAKNESHHHLGTPD